MPGSANISWLFYPEPSTIEVRINFSTTSLPVTTYNNLTGNANSAIRSIANLVDITGANTGWSISTIGTEAGRWGVFSGVTSSDNLAAATTGMSFLSGATSNVWASFYFNYCGGSTNYNASLPQLRISGLNTSKTYELKLAAGDGNNSFGCNPVRFRAVGATSPSFIDINGNNGATDVSTGATFTLQPDGSGNIDIWFNGTGGSSEYAVLNGMIITQQ